MMSEAPIDTIDNASYKASSILSKKRYYEIEELVKKTLHEEDEVQSFMKKFSDIMMFDPEKKKYNQAENEYIKRYREKKKLQKQTCK